MTKIIKRDGTIVDFDINRIADAIFKAQESGDPAYAFFNKYPVPFAHSLKEKYADVEFVGIDQIQADTEAYLKHYFPKIGKAYLEYRIQRDRVRESQSDLAKSIKGLITLTNKEIVNENANKDAKVFPVQRDLMAGIVSKHFAHNILPADVLKAHEDGDIHFHDMDYSPFLPMTNCCLVDLKGMLENGFKLGNAQIESPKSIGVACAIMAQITAQVASHQYGGTTFANIDQVLATYAEKSFIKHVDEARKYNVEEVRRYAEEKTIKEIYDGIQAYEYEVNTLFTTNGQQPFVTVSFGMGTSWAEREIQKAILQVRIKGLGKEGLTAVFPKLVMFMEKGVNLDPEDGNYDIKQLALECSSKRMYPDIISASINRKITGSSVPVSPMGCRSFLSVWENEDGKEILDGRNNLGVVSLNLPRIAIEAKGSVEDFDRILAERVGIAKKALMCRIDRLRGVRASVAPILYTEGAFGVRLRPDDEILDILRNKRASISLGYIGLHEVALCLFGKPAIEDKHIQGFLRGLVRQLKDYCDDWTEETGFAFSLYSTPSESLCDRFCRLDVAKYGEIKGVTDKGWYMNSFHLDVDEKVNPFDKIDFEARFHGIATGGHISYCEFPNMRNNLPALEKVWDYAMANLAYFGTNTPADKCMACGHEGEFTIDSNGFSCPACGNSDSKTINVIRRVCGYLGAPNARGFNRGKNLEVAHRVKHM